MKSFITVVLVMAFLFGPVYSYAQTATTSSTQIQSLLEQIKTLQTQITALKTAQSQLVTAQSNISQTFKLIKNLKEGLSGEDVRTLQTILASDSSIYPEGIVSGFYGRLTAEAVKKFQKKHGINSLGFVGPKTLEKLNKEIEKLGLSNEDDEDGDRNEDENRGREKKLCTKIPPGHLVAPGWIKKNGDVRNLVPECQKLPYGISKKLDDRNGTTTPVVLSNVSVSMVATSSAKISWNTNVLTSSKLYYSTSSPLSTTSVFMLSSNIFTTNPMFSLTGLMPNTVYYFMVESKNNANNIATSSQSSFVTLALSVVDTTSPVISSVVALPVSSTTATVSWSTNESSTSKVYYSTSTPINMTTSMFSEVAGLVSNHSVGLTPLTASTTYYFVVESKDASNNTATSSQASFNTTS